jgi:hypothetical protein
MFTTICNNLVSYELQYIVFILDTGFDSTTLIMFLNGTRHDLDFKQRLYDVQTLYRQFSLDFMMQSIFEMLFVLCKRKFINIYFSFFFFLPYTCFIFLQKSVIS